MKILLGLTGSVAAITAPKLYHFLKEIGEVKVVATPSVEKFAPNFIENADPYLERDEWSWKKVGDDIAHIELRDWYDVFVIAPLSANTLGKMAHGICDNLLTTVWMASLGKRVIVAPAMNTQMWKHPLVQSNLAILKKLDVIVIDPIVKTLACGETGVGAMAQIEDIVNAVKSGG